MAVNEKTEFHYLLNMCLDQNTLQNSRIKGIATSRQPLDMRLESCKRLTGNGNRGIGIGKGFFTQPLFFCEKRSHIKEPDIAAFYKGESIRWPNAG
jgi:hypothetical protein